MLGTQWANRTVRAALGFMGALALLVGCGGGGGGSDALLVVTAGSMTQTSEAGGQITVSVVLAEQPTSPVTIPVASSDTTEGTVSITSVTFTVDNWNAPRTVTVTGVNDTLTDGTQTYRLNFGPSTSMDTRFAGLTASSPDLTNLDNDTAGVTVSEPSGDTHESGGTATFTVVLTSGPSADVVIGVTSSDPGEGTPDVSSLTFTPDNWDAPQTVTVIGADDVEVDGAQSYAIELGAPMSEDAAYAALPAPADVELTNLDNDSPGIIVSAASGHTTEAGGTATFTVRLGSPPAGNVVVHFDTDDATEGTVSTTSLTFTSANWVTPQTVTVTGVNDAISDGNQPYAVVFTAQTGDDAAYNALPPPDDVELVNDDDDVPGLTIVAPSAASSLNRTSEFGFTATFTVRLNTQPTATVNVNFDTNAANEGTPNVTSLMFTTANWNTPQTVTVTGQNDADVDGPQSYAIVFTALTGGDPTYAGLPPPANIAFTNLDDETPFRLRTEYAEGGATFYLVVGRLGAGGAGAASSMRAVVTPLSDASVIADDFRFYVRSGLSGSGLSFESVSRPMHFLRFDSVTPTRYPMCNESSTRSFPICMWDFASVANREYVVWVEPFVDNATHRAEATFTAEGTPAKNRFRSVLAPTRLLRHASYQMVVWPVTPTPNNNEWDFMLEQ